MRSAGDGLALLKERSRSTEKISQSIFHGGANFSDYSFESVLVVVLIVVVVVLVDRCILVLARWFRWTLAALGTFFAGVFALLDTQALNVEYQLAVLGNTGEGFIAVGQVGWDGDSSFAAG